MTKLKEHKLTSASLFLQVQEKVVTKLKEHKLTRKLFESRTLDAVDADDARVRVRTLEPEDPRVQDVSEQLQLEAYPVCTGGLSYMWCGAYPPLLQR